MKLTTREELVGSEISEELGLVKGSTIRAKHVGRDIMAGLKSIVGGELRGYTEALNEARDEAIKRMEDEAEKMGADAIVGVRFSTSQVIPGAAEIMVYGTAVKTK